MNDLRTSLHRVAEAVEPLPVDDDLWERGVAARRRGQALVVAAVLAIIASVTWSAVLLRAQDREARTASTEVVQGGAIPSRIEDPSGLSAKEDLSVGRASVAFVDDDSDVVVVSATDGRYHALALPEAPVVGPVQLSPDGSRLAYAYAAVASVDGERESGTAVLDLESGEVRRFPAVDSAGRPAAVSSLAWSPGSTTLAWWSSERVIGVVDVLRGEQASAQKAPVRRAPSAAVSVNDSAWLTLVTRERVEGWTVEADGSGSGASSVPLSRDLPSDPGTVASRQPEGPLTAAGSTSTTRSVSFVTEEGAVSDRPLPRQLYPSGAAQLVPLGWADNSLLVASVDGPSGSYVEGRHLVLMTSPDRPRSQWTYRILMRDVADVSALSVAVDLVPELDGTSSQQLTRDFGDVLAPDQRDISWIIGLGVAAAIAVLMALRWLWRRLLGG